MKHWLGIGLLGLFSFSSLGFSSQSSLSSTLETIRLKFGAPSLAATIVKNGAILESAAVGERAIGSEVAVQMDDMYHLGSLSKSFTATLIAKLVEQKLLAWDSTLETIFSKQKMLPAYRKVTLEQLLFHVAGFAANVELVDSWQLEPQKARGLYLEKALNQAPEHSAGQMVAYSNTGFVLASLAAEQVTGKSWEKLIQEFIFAPLEMKNCAFGTRFAKLTQPHGHQQNGTILVAVSPELPNGNSNVLFGADGIRCSLPDLGKYLLAHLNGENGTGGIVSSQSFAYLHQPRINAGQGIYAALGWFIFPNGAIWHNGSNTLNFAEMIILPKANLAVAIATNSPIGLGSAVTEAAMDAVLKWLPR